MCAASCRREDYVPLLLGCSQFSPSYWEQILLSLKARGQGFVFSNKQAAALSPWPLAQPPSPTPHPSLCFLYPQRELSKASRCDTSSRILNSTTTNAFC